MEGGYAAVKTLDCCARHTASARHKLGSAITGPSPKLAGLTRFNAGVNEALGVAWGYRSRVLLRSRTEPLRA